MARKHGTQELVVWVNVSPLLTGVCSGSICLFAGGASIDVWPNRWWIRSFWQAGTPAQNASPSAWVEPSGFQPPVVIGDAAVFCSLFLQYDA